MKFAIVFFALFSQYTFAECVNTYNSAANDYNRAGKYAKMSQDSFSEMKEMASNGASDSEMCNKGQEARMASYLAAVNYRKARSGFADAINECNPPADKKAAGYSDKATEAYNSNAEFVAKMDNILGAKCNANPLTPILNKDN